MKSRRIYCLITVVIMLLCLAGYAQAEPAIVTTAESAVLMDYATGKVLFEKNADKELPPASVTKVMTLLVAMDALEQGKVKLTDVVSTSENAANMGGSQIYLEPGEEMSMKTMLISIAVGSANDACVAVAEHVAGSHEAYVKMMNDKAAALGLKHTHFVNTYGLPAEKHYTSSRDLAVMIREAAKYPLFNELVGIKRYDLRDGKFVLWNTNKLLWWYRGSEGGKTGWTNEAKYCLASTAKRDNLRLIAVVMATPEPRSHFRESMKLYNYGFAQYEAVPIAKAGQILGKVRVHKGTLDWVEVTPKEDVVAVVRKGQKESVTYKLFTVPVTTAEVVKGMPLGNVTVYNEKQKASQIDLISTKAVPEGTVFRHMFKLLHTVYAYNK